MKQTANGLSTGITHRFVEYIPEELEKGVLYVSMEYATAVHSCCCGCGCRVVTPLRPVSWKITFDGETVTLYPSIGNWSFPCRSHYWIRESQIEWSYAMTADEISEGRAGDRRLRESYFGRDETVRPAAAAPHESSLQKWLRRLKG